MYVERGRKWLFDDWRKANWEDGELPLTAMSKTVDGAILSEGLEISFGHVKFERNQNTNLMKLRYKTAILILCHDSVVIVRLFIEW